MITTEYYSSHYESLSFDYIQDIRRKYKVIDVDWLDFGKIKNIQ